MKDALRGHLARLYGERVADEYLERFLRTMALSSLGPVGFTESDAVLLIYPWHLHELGSSGSSVLSEMGVALATLPTVFNRIHVLPPYPSDGDFGFAPLSHTAIEPAYGTWLDIESLTQHWAVSLDLVMNHVAPGHEWFQKHIAGERRYSDYFIKVQPDADFSRVAPSRYHPPVSYFETSNGLEAYWTRYGRGQVDLNYANPEVLLKFAQLIQFYARRGVRALRFDAVAFVWKDLQTPSSNQPEAIEIAQLLSLVARHQVQPMLVFIETDSTGGRSPYVSHAIDTTVATYSYSTAPAVLGTVLEEDVSILAGWVRQSGATMHLQTALNFLSTHDGIYLRPNDPPVEPVVLESLARRVERCGGKIVERQGQMYEFDVAVSELFWEDNRTRYDKLLLALFLIVVLPGVPVFYLDHIAPIGNNHLQVRSDIDYRWIGRGVLSREKASALRADPRYGQFVTQLESLLAVRANHDCFSPTSPLRLADASNSSTLALIRVGRRTEALCIVNVGRDSASVHVDGWPEQNVDRYGYTIITREVEGA